MATNGILLGQITNNIINADTVEAIQGNFENGRYKTIYENNEGKNATFTFTPKISGYINFVVIDGSRENSEITSSASVYRVCLQDRNKLYFYFFKKRIIVDTVGKILDEPPSDNARFHKILITEPVKITANQTLTIQTICNTGKWYQVGILYDIVPKIDI